MTDLLEDAIRAGVSRGMDDAPVVRAFLNILKPVKPGA